MNKIISSWKTNANEWIKIIDKKAIPSRKFTNPAIVEVCEDLKPDRVLDVGCGEGWLTRTLANLAEVAVGTDAIEALIENAKVKGKGIFYRLTYQNFIDGYQLNEAPFDLIVFNFSIYQKNHLDKLLKKLQKQLTKNGHIVVQTLHPYFLLTNNLNYKSQWVEDSWKGLPGNFTNGHRWYARTFEDWMGVFNTCNLEILTIKEVLNDTLQPISVIFVVK